MSEAAANKPLDLNLAELVNLSAKLIDQIFIRAPKEKSKPIFKELKQGHRVPLGSVTIQNALKSKLELALDHSEFCGPGFNFDVFCASVRGVLRQISDRFKTQGDFNIMHDDAGTVLIHLPGGVRVNEQINVMVMAFDMSRLEEIVIKLMYVDPQQYEALRQPTS